MSLNMNKNAFPVAIPQGSRYDYGMEYKEWLFGMILNGLCSQCGIDKAPWTIVNRANIILDQVFKENKEHSNDISI